MLIIIVVVVVVVIEVATLPILRNKRLAPKIDFRICEPKVKIRAKVELKLEPSIAPTTSAPVPPKLVIYLLSIVFRCQMDGDPR